MADSPSSSSDDSLDIILPVGFVLLFFLAIFVPLVCILCTHLKRKTLLKLQIALSAEAGSVHRDWTKIFNEAKKLGNSRTSYTPDWHSIITARLFLLQHSDCFRYGYSCVTRYWTDCEILEDRFRQLCEVERQKRETIDIESLVHVNNNVPHPNANVSTMDYVVVTILVTVKGAHNLPKIRNTDDLNKALNYLRDICSNSNKVKGVEVFLTPKYETCSLSHEELLRNYTHLVN
ncbi:hypothetical protein COLO4_04252 [Corchorus olitorius]|uniref:Uncharacterized protein n=1 Tax=Corchorus olitorius TaxID=93759 RepID=A0A1R3KUP2_9ROSI|nr:hypothetical protein COLO4_04252 [Corchorus olitorius]